MSVSRRGARACQGRMGAKEKIQGSSSGGKKMSRARFSGWRRLKEETKLLSLVASNACARFARPAHRDRAIAEGEGVRHAVRKAAEGIQPYQ